MGTGKIQNEISVILYVVVEKARIGEAMEYEHRTEIIYLINNSRPLIKSCLWKI